MPHIEAEIARIEARKACTRTVLVAEKLCLVADKLCLVADKLCHAADKVCHAAKISSQSKPISQHHSPCTARLHEPTGPTTLKIEYAFRNRELPTFDVPTQVQTTQNYPAVGFVC